MTPLVLLRQAIIERAQRRRAARTTRKAPRSIRPAIERLARRLEPQLRKRFLAAVQASKNRVDLEALAQAILGGNVTKAMLAMKLGEWPELYGELALDLRAGFIAGAGLAYTNVGAASIHLRFDLINPYAVSYSSRKLPQIVASYQANAKEIIQAIITEAVGGQHTPDEAARLLRDSIGLTARYERAVAALRQRLRESGVTGERLDTKVDRYAMRLLNSRAKTIARTEIVQAQVSGQRALWNEAANNGLFNRQTATRIWRTNREGVTQLGNETPCEICAPMNGQEIAFNGVYTHPELGNANIFREVLNGPPIHPNCLCHEELKT